MKTRNTKHTERRKRRILSGIIAVVLVAAMALGMFLNYGTNVQAASGKTVVDPDTTNNWTQFTAPDGQPSTQNVGRIWTDKSVFNDTYTFQSKDSEGLNGEAITKGDSDFIIALSALSSTSNLKSTTVTTTPLDIVLVLDTSGSMDNSDGHDMGYSYTPTYSPNNNRTYYIQLDNGTWVTVWHNYNGWYYTTGNNNRYYVDYKRSADDQTEGRYEFNTRSNQQMSRMEALQNAANTFVDSVAALNDDISNTNQQHRISLVKFASDEKNSVGNDFTRDDYNCSQVVADLAPYTSDTASSLKTTINSLYGEGATRADYGLHQAQRVLDGDGSLTGARGNAQKIVIFFTDGEPTSSSSWSNDVASRAVGYANSMKQSGALIYSIGVVQGADPSDDPTLPQTSNINKFLHAVSSNYKNATYQYEGWGPFGSYQWSFGTRTPDANYYYAASDADELDQVFEDITSSITQNAGSGSPIVDNSTEGNTDPGNLVFTDQLGSYMQVTGTGAGDNTIQLAYGDQIYNSTSKSTSGNVDTYHFEGTVGGNAVYGEADLADLTVEVTHSTDLATGDIVKVTVPATLIPMRNYNVDTDNKTMDVSQAYPVRLFYGVSLKADAEKALSDTTSEEYKAIVESQATDSTIDFYSNNFVKDQADGETTAVFEPNASNKFYYFTQLTKLYLDQACTLPAARSNIEGHNTLYYKDTYWQLTGNGTEAKEITDGYGTVTSGTAEWDAIDWGDRWSDQAQIPAGTQRTSRPGTLTAAKTDNVTKTASNVLNPSWSGDDEVTQALGNNGKLLFDKPGSLEIKKTVDWGNASDDTKTNHNSFSFDITATTPTGEDGADENLNGTYNYFVNGAQDPSGTVKFKDGKGTVTMNGGDTLVIEGLPAGASFTVDEQNANSNGFSTTDATSQADVDNTDPKDGSITGTIIAGSQVSLTFTNTYHATDVNLNANTTLKVQKKLEGRDWRDGDSFDFTIDGFYAPTSVSEAPEPENTTITVDASDKDANYTASFGDITFSAPGEYRYTVQENSDPEQPIAGIDYSDAIYRVTVMVGDNGTGALTIDSVKIERMNNDDGTAAGMAEEGVIVQGDTMTFTNTYKADSATQGIQGKKSYTDTTGGNPFEAGKFTFKLEAQGGFASNRGSADDLTIGAADTPMPADAENNAITTGNVGEEFTFPSITFGGNDVGKTYVYKVTEEQGNEQGMTYSKAEHTVMIQVEEVTDDDGTHIKATVLGDYADPSKLVFENEYKPTEAKLEGDSAIHGTKTLTGREMQDGETYYFQLTAVDDNAKSVLPNAQTVGVTKDNMKDGSAGFTFADMSFTKVGTYTFTVNEVADENGTETINGSGMTYDTNVATVKVIVSDTKNGSLKAEVSYSNDKHGDTTDKALFTNVYEASMNYGAQGKGGINVTKTMLDRPMTAGEFSFSIAGTDSSSVTADGANQKLVDGDKSFQNVAAGEGVKSIMAKLQNVSFNQDDAGKTFSYIVDETTESGAAQVSYDKSQYRVDIQVVDNGDGTMHTVTTVTQIKDVNGNDVSNVVIDKANSDADGYTAPTFGFTNDYNPNPAKVGEDADYKIQVKKTVTGADSATDYTFTLTATGDNIGNITGLDKNSQLTVKTDGTIKAGESQTKTFGDLTFSEPGTYTFTVQENKPVEDAGWTFDTTARTVTVVVTDLNKEGKYDGCLYIARVTGSPVEITNSYKAEPVIVGGEDAEQKITVQKSVTGKNPDGAFNFKIEPVYDDTNTEDVWKQNVEPVDNDFDAQTTVSGVTTEQSQTASFSGIKFKAAGEYKFKITEVGASTGNTPAGWTYDTHESFATVKVTDNGEGQLTATVSYDNSKAVAGADKKCTTAAAFTNSYTPDETTTTDDTSVDTNIKVTKQVTGAPAAEAFTFKLKKAEGQDYTNVYEGTGSDKTPFDGMEVTTTGNMDAGASETKAFAGVTFTAPGDYKFVIDETTTTDKAGWTYDGSEHEITVHVEDKDAKLAITGIDGNNPTFTNSYKPNEVTTDGKYGLDNLQVTKEVTGAPALSDFDFSLKLTSGDINNVKLGSGETETAFPAEGITAGTSELTGKEDDEAKQKVSFGDISFTATGTYTFEVAETTTTDEAGWSYDNKAKTITVEVTDENFDGQLDAKVTGNNPTVTNKYESGEVTIGGESGNAGITVQKTLSGRDWKDGDSFTFTLTADEGTPMPEEDGRSVTITNESESKTAVFGPITYEEAGVYSYTITETKGDIGGITYDTHPVKVTVTVTDNDFDGYLETTVTYDNLSAIADEDKEVTAAAAFTNVYDANTPGTLQGDSNLRVSKDFQAGERGWLDGDEFTFQLSADEADEATKNAIENNEITMPEESTVNITSADKTACFGNIVFTEPGTYKFLISETVPEGAVQNDDGKYTYNGITYDNSVYTVIVKVTDNLDGTLTAEVQNADENNYTKENGYVFTNTYKPGGEVTPSTGEAEVQLKKTLEGRNWLESDKFSFTITADEGTPEDTLPEETTVTVGKPESGNSNTFEFGPFTFDEEGTYEYTVKENAGEAGGMSYSQNEAHVQIVVKDNLHGGYQAAVTITNNEFINTYDSTLDYVGKGGLNIIKNLKGHAMEDGQFQFTVKPVDQASADKAGIKLDGVTFDSSAAQMTDGVATNVIQVFKELKFNQKDAGTTYKYTITESKGGDESKGYTNDDTVYTVSMNVKDNNAGVLTVTTTVSDGLESKDYVYTNEADQPKETAQAVFENVYNAEGTLGGDGEGTAKINATKELVNGVMEGKEFTFKVTDANNNFVTSGTNAADGTISFALVEYTTEKLVADSTGENPTAAYNAQTNTYSYQYQVVESAELPAGVTQNAAAFAITVNVTDNNDGTLTTSVVYPDGSGENLAFKNTYGTVEGGAAELNVGGMKKLDAADGLNPPSIEGKFQFTITGDEGAPMPENTTVTNDAAGNVNFGTIVYTMENVFGNDTASEDEDVANGTDTAEDAGIDTQIAQREKTYTYTITESGSMDGVTNDPETSRTFTVTVTDNGNGTLTAECSETPGAQFTFTNTYSVTPEESTPTGDGVEGGVTITKTIDGRDLKEGEFTFQMADVEGNVVSEGTNDAAGNVELGGITFEKPGTYSYTIREVNNGLGGVTYDTSVYNATAEVTDDQDGTLSVAWEVKAAGGEALDAVTFANSYKAAPASVSLGAAKRLDGRALKDGEFTFELKDEDGNVVSSAKNDENGAVAFDTISFDKAGTYKYTVTEAAGSDAAITYDNTVYNVTITVTDDGNGSLSASADTGDKALVFTNKYTKPAEPQKPDDSNAVPADGTPKAVQTGDTTPIIPAVIAVIASLAAIAAVVVIIMRRRRR